MPPLGRVAEALVVEQQPGPSPHEPGRSNESTASAESRWSILWWMLKRQRPPNVLEALGGYITLKMSLVELLSRPSYRHLKQQVSSRRGSLPLPAPAEQTQHAKPSGEKRESG